VISHVPLDLTVDDIKEETGCIWAHRITRKNNSGDEYVPTMTVIIAYEDDDLPKYVNICFTRHKVSAYIPTPLRCECQRYRHKADKPHCPRFAQAHEYGVCSAAPEQVKCAKCGEKHRSAYKCCQKYREISSALKLATTQKISYRDAQQQSKTAARKPASAPVNPTPGQTVSTHTHKEHEAVEKKSVVVALEAAIANLHEYSGKKVV